MMWGKRLVSKLLRGLIDFFFKNRAIPFVRYFPFGFDYIYDIIKDQHTNEGISTIIDVGANVGQSALRFSKFFRGAEIHSFEPIKSTFNILEQNCKKYGNIRLHNIALGSKKGVIEIKLQDQSLNNSLSPTVQRSIRSDLKQEVSIDTLENVAQTLNISAIDILKIDTEGFDLEVLKGAEKLLKCGLIRYIYCEVGFNTDISKVRLHQVTEYLNPYGYQFVGLYENMRIAFSQLPIKISNAFFVYRNVN